MTINERFLDLAWEAYADFVESGQAPPFDEEPLRAIFVVGFCYGIASQEFGLLKPTH